MSALWNYLSCARPSSHELEVERLRQLEQDVAGQWKSGVTLTFAGPAILFDGACDVGAACRRSHLKLQWRPGERWHYAEGEA